MNRRVVVAASVDINTRASSLCNRALCNGPVSVGEHAQPSGYRFFLHRNCLVSISRDGT